MAATHPSITSGLVDAHSHLRSTSLHQHGVVGGCLEEALLRMTAMTAVDIEDDVFVAACDAVSSGITGVQAVVHTFADADGYLAMVDAVVRGVQHAGVRALIILGITDQAEFLPPGIDGLLEWPSVMRPARGLSIAAYVEVVSEVRRRYPGVAFGVGPIAPQWCSDDALEALGDLGTQGLRMHTHLLESRRQRTWVKGDPIGRLARHGLLTPQTSLAHGVWCSPDDLRLIHECGAQLVACPHSNRSLGAGRADIEAWRGHGIPFGVGLDSVGDGVGIWQVARSVLDMDDALFALTQGGVACTGLASNHDVVEWRDAVGGVVDRVVIAGDERVRAGTVVCAGEVHAARERVTAMMRADERDRVARQAALSKLMREYLDVLDAR